MPSTLTWKYVSSGQSNSTSIKSLSAKTSNLLESFAPRRMPESVVVSPDVIFDTLPTSGSGAGAGVGVEAGFSSSPPLKELHAKIATHSTAAVANVINSFTFKKRTS